MSEAEESPVIDLRSVLADIDAEVASKRASGELPAELERQLDLAFARLAPPDAAEGDFATLISKLEASVSFDTRAPTASRSPWVSQVKGVIGRAIDWDLRHLASQVSSSVHVITRALGLLGERVEALEDDRLGAADAWLDAFGQAGERAALPPGRWDQPLATALAEVTGRVLHAECGAGGLVVALRQAGLDTYGVDPDEETLLADDVADLRVDDTAAHLRGLTEASLGAVVLSGVVDRSASGARLALVDLAITRLGPGGILAVVSHAPDTWAERRPVVADLSSGRPWTLATWTAVLAGHGLRVGTVEERTEGFLITAAR